MRIALCLSGQARFVEQGYREVIYPYILQNNSIDIFIHTWDIGCMYTLCVCVCVCVCLCGYGSIGG